MPNSDPRISDIDTEDPPVRQVGPLVSLTWAEGGDAVFNMGGYGHDFMHSYTWMREAPVAGWYWMNALFVGKKGSFKGPVHVYSPKSSLGAPPEDGWLYRVPGWNAVLRDDAFKKKYFHGPIAEPPLWILDYERNHVTD